MVDFSDEISSVQAVTTTPKPPALKEKEIAPSEHSHSSPPPLPEVPPFKFLLGPYLSVLGSLELQAELDGDLAASVSASLESQPKSISFSEGHPERKESPFFEALFHSWVYAIAIEKLKSVQVSEYTEFLRVASGELARIGSHLYSVGRLVATMNSAGTELQEALQQRKQILSLFQAKGPRECFCAGGCTQEAAWQWVQEARKVLEATQRTVERWTSVLPGNEILLCRLQNVGVLSGSQALKGDITGCNLRASALGNDVRIISPYSIYPQLDFTIPIGADGDAYDRMMIRLLECRQSVQIVKQALERLERVSFSDQAPASNTQQTVSGETSAEIESPLGLLSCTLFHTSSGTLPYCYFNKPGLIHLTTLEDLCTGHTLADITVLLGSLNIFLEESH